MRVVLSRVKGRVYNQAACLMKFFGLLFSSRIGAFFAHSLEKKMSQIYKQPLYPQSVTFLQYCLLGLDYVVFALFSLFHFTQFRFVFHYFDSIVGHADFLGFLRSKTSHSQIDDMHVEENLFCDFVRFNSYFL